MPNKDPLRRSEYGKQWYAENKERLKADPEHQERQEMAQKKYRDANKQKRYEYMRQWYADHPGYSKEKYHALSSEKKAEYLADMREKYKTTWGPTARANAKRSRVKVKAEVIAAYGGKCACCGETELDFLSIDHIFGSGKKHVQSLNIGRGFQFYGYLRRNGFPDKDKLRVLCMNCNFALGVSRCDVCPHQRQQSVSEVKLEDFVLYDKEPELVATYAIHEQDTEYGLSAC